MKPAKGGYMRISDFLPAGANHAVTAKELKTFLHMTERELSQRIRSERLDGIPICSRTHTDADGKAGYFMPATADDFTATIRQLKAREREIMTVRIAMEKAYNTRYGK